MYTNIFSQCQYTCTYIYLYTYRDRYRYRYALAPWAAWAACDWIAAAVGQAPWWVSLEDGTRLAARYLYLAVHLLHQPHMCKNVNWRPCTLSHVSQTAAHNKHRLTTIQWTDWHASLALKKSKMYQDHPRSSKHQAVSISCFCLSTFILRPRLSQVEEPSRRNARGTFNGPLVNRADFVDQTSSRHPLFYSI